MTDSTPKTLPDADFVRLGGGHIAYIREILSDDLGTIFPQAPRMAPGLKLWALLGADGTPIVLTDSRAAAEVSALQNELKAVSVH